MDGSRSTDGGGSCPIGPVANVPLLLSYASEINNVYLAEQSFAELFNKSKTISRKLRQRHRGCVSQRRGLVVVVVIPGRRGIGQRRVDAAVIDHWTAAAAAVHRHRRAAVLLSAAERQRSWWWRRSSRVVRRSKAIRYSVRRCISIR